MPIDLSSVKTPEGPSGHVVAFAAAMSAPPLILPETLTVLLNKTTDSGACVLRRSGRLCPSAISTALSTEATNRGDELPISHPIIGRLDFIDVPQEADHSYLLGALRREYDFLVVAPAIQYQDPMSLFLRHADQVVLLVSRSVHSARVGLDFIELLHRLNIPDEQILLTIVDSGSSLSPTTDELAVMLEREIPFILPWPYSQHDQSRHRRDLFDVVERNPDVMQAIKSLAMQLINYRTTWFNRT